MPEDKPVQTKVIEEFVDKMIADKGLGVVSTEKIGALRENLCAKLEEQVEQAMLRALSDEQLVELEKLVDSGASDEELDEFFDNSGVDFTKAAEQAMSEFRKAFLDSAVLGEEK